MNFNDIKFNMDKNFNCLARLIYINNIIKLEYNTFIKLNKNFINFDFQISEEEEKLIKKKNLRISNNLEYKILKNKNYGNTFYGYFKYDPEGSETKYIINGFGIEVSQNYKYIGEFKNGKRHGYGIHYFDNGAFKFTKKNLDSETYKLYTISGQIEFCFFNTIVDKYQKYGFYQIERTNGKKKINVIKNNNFDDYGIEYNINGELYEGYYLSNVKNSYGILKSGNKNQIGLFYKDKLKFGRIIYKDHIIEGEFNMGLEDGYIIEYDQLKRKLFEGQYKNGKKEGIGISYNDKGNISYQGYYKNNLEDVYLFRKIILFWIY